MGRVVLSLLLTCAMCGCISPLPSVGRGNPPDAIYENPSTGELWHCENPGLTAAVRGGILAASAYADCKTAAEARGWLRRRDLDGSTP